MSYSSPSASFFSMAAAVAYSILSVSLDAASNSLASSCNAGRIASTLSTLSSAAPASVATTAAARKREPAVNRLTLIIVSPLQVRIAPVIDKLFRAERPESPMDQPYEFCLLGRTHIRSPRNSPQTSTALVSFSSPAEVFRQPRMPGLPSAFDTAHRQAGSHPAAEPIIDEDRRQCIDHGGRHH